MYAMILHLRTLLKPLLRWTPVQNSILLTPSGSLNSLPIELLSEVMYNLDWADVLQLRQVCKCLHSASYERSVWLDIFLRHSQVEPRLFHLEKPLQLHSSAELEALVVRWKAIDKVWSVNNARPAVERPFVVKDKAHSCSHLVKGGRWFLVGTSHGEVHYCDLETADITPRILIPAPVDLHLGPNTNDSAQMRISIDIDQDSPYLSFNLAMFIATNEQGQLCPVQVWRVRANCDEFGRVSGLLAQKLSSFLEEADCDICQISLLGNQVAYSIRHAHPKRRKSDVVVVDWEKADGASLDYRRRVTTNEVVDCLYLIPENGIICAGSTIALYDVDDLAITTSSASNLSFRAPLKWCPAGADLGSLSGPYFAPDSIRFLWTMQGSVGGLMIRPGHLAFLELKHFWEGNTWVDGVQLGYNLGVSFYGNQLQTIKACWHDQQERQYVSPKAFKVAAVNPRAFVDDVSGNVILTSQHGDEHTLINFLPYM